MKKVLAGVLLMAAAGCSVYAPVRHYDLHLYE